LPAAPADFENLRFAAGRRYDVTDLFPNSITRFQTTYRASGETREIVLSAGSALSFRTKCLLPARSTTLQRRSAVAVDQEQQPTVGTCAGGKRCGRRPFL